jgi:hypothetical protein
MPSTKALGDLAQLVSLDSASGLLALTNPPSNSETSTDTVASTGNVKDAKDLATAAKTKADAASDAIDGISFPGDIKMSMRNDDHGKWLIADGRSIGNAGSGAWLADLKYLSLYSELWADLDNPDVLGLKTSTGAVASKGISASADFASGKRILLPDMRGLTPRGHHFGSVAYETDTTRTIGSVQLDAIKAHDHTIPAYLYHNYTPDNYTGGNTLVDIAGNPGVNRPFTSIVGGFENRVRNRSVAFFIRY